MTEFYALAKDSPWLTLALCVAGLWLINKILRTVKIATRGWPPPHLDADGDFKE